MSKCEVCDEEDAVVTCAECGMGLCADDDMALHAPATKKSHKRVPIGGAASASASASAAPSVAATPLVSARSAAAPPSARRVASLAAGKPLCELCDIEDANLTCKECGQDLCQSCSDEMHKPARLAGHTRTPIGGAAAPTAAAPKPAPAAAAPAPTPAPAAASRPVSAASAAPSVAASVKATPAASTAGSPQYSAVPTPVSSPPATAPSSSRLATAPGSARKLAPLASPKSALCDLCEDEVAAIQCKECEQILCQACSEEMHKPARMAGHSRIFLGGSNATPTPAPEPTPPPAPIAAFAPATPARVQAASSPVEAEEKDQNTTPQPAKRAMSASQSVGALGAVRPRSGRPRSSRSTTSSAGRKPPQLDVPASLAFAPRSLQQALSPQRNVLSMSYGSRWEEPDCRKYIQDRPGTFGSQNRDGSPKKNRNLLYSKSASDLGVGQSTGSGNPAWVRLAKPKVFVSSVISPLFDDIKNCSFTPKVSPLSQTIAPGQFQDRLAASVKIYKDRVQAPEGTGWTDKEATFKPKLNDLSRFTEKLGGASFVDRMYGDLRDRKQKLAEIEASQLFSFQPEISSSSKKRAATITTPFLDRLREDLDSREDGTATRKAEADRAITAMPFQPNPERHRAHFGVFLGRMENDLDERKEKYEARCKLLGVPSVQERASSAKSR